MVGGTQSRSEAPWRCPASARFDVVELRPETGREIRRGCSGLCEPVGSRSASGPRRGTQVTRRTRVGQYARLWWESQGTGEDRRGVLDVGRVR